MSGPSSDASPPLTVLEQAASLRHDLVNPISLIVGYAELLEAEAGDLGLGAAVAPLGSIRRIALALLRRIDRVLLADPAGRDADALRRLGEDLLGPALLLVREADALVRSLRADAHESLADDLDKIRTAGAHLVVLAESLESGLVADA